jgi:hypothetical protein
LQPPPVAVLYTANPNAVSLIHNQLPVKLLEAWAVETGITERIASRCLTVRGTVG